MNNTEFKTSFADNDFNEWKKKLLREIKLEDYAQAIKTDRNGISIDPIYHQSAQPADIIPRHHADWWIVNQYYIDGNEDTVNKIILKDLNDGVSGINLKILSEKVNIDSLLNQIDPTAIQLIWTTSEISQNTTDTLVQFLNHLHYNYSSGLIHFENHELYQYIQNQLYIPGLIYNNAGANTITELSAVLSQVNQGLDELSTKDKLHSLQSISISLAVDTQYFEQISKIRSIKSLVYSILLAYKIDVPVFIHCETSSVYLTQKDHNNNLIRNTVASMAAIISGADSLRAVPHNFYLCDSQEKSDNRLAKNQQLLLKEESYFTTFLNAPDGSYFIENYTEQLTSKAYEKFQQIEVQGGWISAKEVIINNINEDKKELIFNYKNKNKTLIGINKYPNNMENVSVAEISPKSWQGIFYMNLEQEITE